MSGFGIPRLFGKRPTTTPTSDETPILRVHLLLETDDARDSLIAWAEKHLPEGECLVEAKELAGRRRAFVTCPDDKDAELVAHTVPKLLRGRLLSTTRYYRVASDRLDATERHYEEGRYSHSYATTLKPLVRGRAGRDLPLIES